jgi:hypothetical protein
MEPAGDDPLGTARAQATRRLEELRDRAAHPASPGPDLRTMLARTDRHVGEIRDAARDLAALLPTRVEAAVARALAEDEGGLARRLDGLQDEAVRTGSSVERIERDLLAERLARIEDLEVVVDLLSGGLDSLRSDLARLSALVEDMAARLETPVQVTVVRPKKA